jgi:hypothetical protein
MCGLTGVLLYPTRRPEADKWAEIKHITTATLSSTKNEVGKRLASP